MHACVHACMLCLLACTKVIKDEQLAREWVLRAYACHPALNPVGCVEWHARG